MKQKWPILIFSALLTAFIVLAGIWGNAQFEHLHSGSVLTAQQAVQGIALDGWRQEAPGQWHFTFTVGEDIPSLTLCVTNTAVPLAHESLTSLERSGELYALDVTPGETVELVFTCGRSPQTWLMTSAFADRAFRFRTMTQLIALTAFVTMGMVLLALYHYKHLPELGYFLLYLVIMSVWALMVFFFPAIRNRLLQRILRSFFSLTVLASALLAAGLLGVKLPRSGRGFLALAAGCVVFFALSTSSYPPLRVGMLVAGMCLCLYYLMAAVNADYEGAALMLLPGAVTTGFRVWALMPGLDSALFVESVPFYLLRCSRLYDLPFAIGCMVFVCRRFALLFDRTEQLARELDARVAERTKELTAETEARKSMMLNIFHDLRSPLFAVSGGLETLGSAPEALPALLPALRQRIEFLRRLTEDLFLAAKLEQKQILLNEDRAALNEEAAAVCAACRSEADKKGVELHVSADTPLPVWGDSVRLQQIIQNLVTNAIHYTPAGGSIHVGCCTEGETACVSVQDTGCGIAPEDQSAVFDRYFHTTADKKHDSTGLGLTIAQELAHLHHGEITLQSEVGKGSMFTLRLPLLTD
jgi:two-component system phosphate regulon sensor histidine kinase PhoR